MSDKAVRLCLFCHSIGPYHVARYAALSKKASGLVVVELASQQKLYPWVNSTARAGIAVETLFDRALERVSCQELAESIWKALDRLQPRVVVAVGYGDAAMRTASLWARVHPVANVSILIGETWNGDKRRWVPLEVAKWMWCSWAYDAAFVGGVRHMEYFASLGVPRDRIWRGVDAVDNPHFAIGTLVAKQREVELRKVLGLPERYFVCIARLSPEKNIARLLQAFSLYRKNGGNWALVLVGSGPQERALRSMAMRLASGAIHFAGWQQYADLPRYYGLASALVLPSLSEPWGLVVNEAMAAGLPVLVSNRCGCVPELCHNGVNGYQFDPKDVNWLAYLMRRISSSEVDLERMGQASQRIIANFTPETWADALWDCIQVSASDDLCK